MGASVFVWSIVAAILVVDYVWRAGSPDGEGPWVGLAAGVLIVVGGGLYWAGL